MWRGPENRGKLQKRKENNQLYSINKGAAEAEDPENKSKK